MKRVLTIGGSDPLAGGGIQSDLKTFENFKIFGLSTLTCIGAFDSKGEFVLDAVSPELLERQLATIDRMTSLDGIKIGLLHTEEAILIVRDFLKNKPKIPVVLDPVFAFKETGAVANQTYMDHLVFELFPLAEVVTPNLREASLLTGTSSLSTLADMLDTAHKIKDSGAKNVVIKGGTGIQGTSAIDLLLTDQSYETFQREKLDTMTVNGAGCTFSSAITAQLVLGNDLFDAVSNSKSYVYHCIFNGVSMKDQIGSVWSGGYWKGEETK